MSLALFKKYLKSNSNSFYEIKETDDKRTISFDDSFNEELNYNILALISGCSHVYFGDEFDKSIDKLPDSVKFIQFGINFNTQVNKWPKNLETLRFDAWDYMANGFCKFNHKLINLPNIKQLKLGTFYKHSINDLPDSIELLFLERSSHLRHPINKLPKNLTTYHFGRNTELGPNLVIPNNIKFIKEW